MTETTGDQQKPDHLFKPGQSGNPAGRPKGSRNKLGEAFVEKLLADFETNGEAAIVKVRTEDPSAYLKVIASILPKELKIERTDELSDAEVDQRLRQLAEFISAEIGISGPAGGKEAAPVPKPAGGVSTLQ